MEMNVKITGIGMTADEVREAMKKYTLAEDKKQAVRRLTKEEKEALRADILTGKFTALELAQKYGIKASSVHYHAVEIHAELQHRKAQS